MFFAACLQVVFRLPAGSVRAKKEAYLYGVLGQTHKCKNKTLKGAYSDFCSVSLSARVCVAGGGDHMCV